MTEPHRRRPAPKAVTGGRPPRLPAPAEIAGAAGRTIPDVIAPGLAVLFCGINPGLLSAAAGFHFARPGNRFWPALHASGFVPRRLQPHEQAELLRFGLGITNLVAGATAAATELSAAELRSGAAALAAKVDRYRPGVVAFLGTTAYRIAFERSRAALGPLPDAVGGVRAWLLPNPSGRNAHFGPADFRREFSRLRAAVARGQLTAT